MDIRWMIFARGIRFHPDESLDILHAFDRNVGVGPSNKLSFWMIGKVREYPTEVGERKLLSLQIRHSDGVLVGEWMLTYHVHDLSTWASKTPYIAVEFPEFEFTRIGEYTFQLQVDQELKAEETIAVM